MDMAVNRDELISSLNVLIETCRNGENGFRTAAENVKDEELKRFFTHCSNQRAQFASELQSEVRTLGGDPMRRGTAAGVIHRGWMNLKSAVTLDSDHAIISECARGEDAAKAAYQEVLKQNLPPNVLPVVKHQFIEIKQTHDRVRDLEQRSKAA
jgi:uncharacterized protein (TIGR02284 family)